MVEAIAAGLGHLLRLLWVGLRSLPGVAGPVVAIAGVWLIADIPVWHALAIVLAGIVLVVADLRIGPRGDR